MHLNISQSFQTQSTFINNIFKQTWVHVEKRRRHVWVGFRALDFNLLVCESKRWHHVMAPVPWQPNHDARRCRTLYPPVYAPPLCPPLSVSVFSALLPFPLSRCFCSFVLLCVFLCPVVCVSLSRCMCSFVPLCVFLCPVFCVPLSPCVCSFVPFSVFLCPVVCVSLSR